MRVHHLNCATLGARGGRWLGTARLVSHCLLIETGEALALVDTGLGLEDVRRPRARLGLVARAELWRAGDEGDTALRQIERRGFSPRDVRHILLTHLDFDHAGGISDFPQATVHLMAKERTCASWRRSLLNRVRYRPAQWRSHERWQVYDPGDGESWFGFDSVRALGGLPEDILFVPLAGHSFGHAGVAVRTGGRWLLHAGDAYFFHGEMDPDVPFCPSGLRALERVMAHDPVTRAWNQERLRELLRAHGDEVDVFCAHDPDDLARFTAAPRPSAVPAAGADAAPP